MATIEEAQEKFLTRMNNRKRDKPIPEYYVLHNFVCKMTTMEALKIYNERM